MAHAAPLWRRRWKNYAAENRDKWGGVCRKSVAKKKVRDTHLPATRCGEKARRDEPLAYLYLSGPHQNSGARTTRDWLVRRPARLPPNRTSIDGCFLFFASSVSTASRYWNSQCWALPRRKLGVWDLSFLHFSFHLLFVMMFLQENLYFTTH